MSSKRHWTGAGELSSNIDNLARETLLPTVSTSEPDQTPARDAAASGTAARGTAARQAVMAVLAEARVEEIAEGLAAMAAAIACPDHGELRPAETGLVMIRGRIGGDGAPFNLGEATVTRAAVQLASGEIGFSYVLGRDREKARLAALCEALCQCGAHRDAVEQHVMSRVRARLAAEDTRAREQAAATRVDFFTLVRGEDAR
jgi:alpha-D-ribose 1-methylphosphonate 5-triphosphate synthase subunit PhnG